MAKKCKDFCFSIAMILLGAYVVIESLNIYHKAAEIPYRVTQFTISPGFLPFLLGLALLLTAVLLFIGSFKGETVTEALTNRKNEFNDWAKQYFNKGTRNMLIGCAMMCFYTFVLVQYLPFWLASIIFLIIMFLFLRIGTLRKPFKAIIIAVLVVAAIVLLFKYGFGAALPE